MSKQLQKFGKDIIRHYMWYWEGEEIIIPFATEDTARVSMDELAHEFILLSFKLKQVHKGWDIVVSEAKCKHEHLIDVEKVEGKRYGPQCKDCGEFVKC
jgi:hypothetical protein